MQYQRRFLTLALGLILGSLLVRCDQPSIEPGRKAKSGPPLPKPPVPQKPDVSCEQQWEEFSQMNPRGRITKYLIQQNLMIDGVPQLLQSSQVFRTVGVNDKEAVGWQERIEVELPQQETTNTDFLMKKEVFLSQCAKEVNFRYSEKPAGYSPKDSSEEKIRLGTVEFDVVHEKYIFSEASSAKGIDQLDLWIGNKGDSIGVLFKKQRRVQLEKAVGGKGARESVTVKELLELSH